MKVLLAKNAGACYGVQRALEMANRAASLPGEVCTLGPLIHNPMVVAQLEARGVRVAETLDDIESGTVIIRSHGVTPEVRDELGARSLSVLDATCPHVLRAQNGAAELAREGCRVIVVGEAGHPEVLGIAAYARREGARVDVASSPDEVPGDLRAPIGVVVQTTQKSEVLDVVVEAIRAQGIEPIVKNTICTATRKRQDETAQLAETVGAMVVLGGRNSSNTTRLAEICTERCVRTFHVESPDELCAKWFDGCEVVGVTAGASTPEDQITALVAALEQL